MKGLRKHLSELLCVAESCCCHSVFSKTGNTRQKFSLGSFTAHFRHLRVDMDQEAIGGISLKALRYCTVCRLPPGLGLKMLAFFKQNPVKMLSLQILE